MAYTDSSGNEFESYEDACRYYGIDTPEQVAAEEVYWREVEAEAWLDHCAEHDLFVDEDIFAGSHLVEDFIPF